MNCFKKKNSVVIQTFNTVPNERSQAAQCTVIRLVRNLVSEDGVIVFSDLVTGGKLQW